MKVLMRISLLVITVLSLTIVFCRCQSVAEQAEQSYAKGVAHAVLGNFNEAKEEFDLDYVNSMSSQNNLVIVNKHLSHCEC